MSLAIPGAVLHYEVFKNTESTNPSVLFITGAPGTVEPWRPLTSFLSAHPAFKHNLICYDRRGFSRSYLSSTEPQDFTHRLDVDADDAKLLIDTISPNGKPVVVIGTSSGAIVALNLLLRYPDKVTKLICHEPPLIKLLEDGKELEERQDELYATYRDSGIPPAMMKFADLYRVGKAELMVLGSAMAAQSGPFIGGNTAFWFERELRQYTTWDIDVGGVKNCKERVPIVFVNGKETDKQAPYARANAKLAEACEQQVEYFPGAHVGYATDTEAFAEALIEILGD
ncbi:Alpha/Beta hydrolase protein [Dendryphion nanum]|uniref:Alpha/Beta hydrolase protein n=1 Tax=Dendryphion nanum TaxID=256645 RepID=A0A9P9E7C6_9PLEO|nr:Alpha/Beta hydrolase protein [Dendryphion nanum]